MIAHANTFRSQNVSRNDKTKHSSLTKSLDSIGWFVSFISTAHYDMPTGNRLFRFWQPHLADGN
jgi:hypothetical protein